MDTNINYAAEKSGYIKVLIGLLVLTAVTFIQPSMFLTDHNFAIQMLIGLAKAYMILVYYMHLKGETLIATTVWFSLGLVAFFFLIVMIDVSNFQYGDVSHITSEATSAGTTSAAKH